jgi:CubicO group peptidase (beta-lactamase class C family)
MNTAREVVSGFVAPGFEPVRAAFLANFQSGLDVGATFAVVRRGVPVVDLWGGHADQARSVALQRDALFNLWSTSKGLAGICIALLVDRGKLHYESPVVKYWPEFAAHGKHTVTVAQLMAHQAGVCGPRERVTMEDYYAHERVASLLARQEPFFEPGTAWGYHAIAIGTLADELVRRVDGRTIGQFFADEIAAPFAIDAFLGLPESQEPRQVETLPPPGEKLPTSSAPNPAAYAAALENPPLDASWANSRVFRARGLSSVGGRANARSLALLYGILANGGEVGGRRLLSLQTIAEATKQRAVGIDQVLGRHALHCAGFYLNVYGKMGPYPQSFGYDGWGGSMAFADPFSGLGISYVMNQMLITEEGNVDPRLLRLLSSTYAALSKL